MILWKATDDTLKKGGYEKNLYDSIMAYGSHS